MPISPPPPTPAERFADILWYLAPAVAAQTGWGLSLSLIALIITRLREINQRVARLAARIREGRYSPRRSAPRRPPADRRPRQPSTLPHDIGWLLKLLPGTIGYRAQLEYLLQDEEMAALLAAAPGSLGRPLRSLCWMLRVTPPKILARPAKPRPPREKKPRPRREPLPPPYPPTPPDAPAWMQNWPRSRTRWTPPRNRGSPRSA